VKYAHIYCCVGCIGELGDTRGRFAAGAQENILSKRFMAHRGPAIALVCAMHCGTAQAQDQTADEPSGGAIALEGISIFATLSPIASFDYPGQVGVVDREELETRQASTLADVFAGVPGVQVDGGARRSGQVPTIRGIREEDTSS
jgi:outer membrane receptor for ferrienterochelin and colicin